MHVTNDTGVAESPMIHESTVRVVIAHEHPIFRYGLKLLLEETRGFHVVGEAADGVHAVQLSRDLQADVLLMDLAIPAGGLETLQSLATSAPSVRPVVLIGDDDKAQLTALRFGARGVVPRESPVAELFSSITAVMRGESWHGDASAPRRAAAMRAKSRRGPTNRFRLTKRELQIVAAVADGETNKGIAARFSVTEDTVKHHLSSVFDKLGVFSRLELAVFAINHGLIGEDQSVAS
jgi:DNA-binding NarL/FixJ family response regulator